MLHPNWIRRSNSLTSVSRFVSKKIFVRLVLNNYPAERLKARNYFVSCGFFFSFLNKMTKQFGELNMS